MGRAVASLLAQDYPGEFSVVLVDDHSQDGTAGIARAAAAASGKSERLRIVSARALPPGWSGKLWALSEGVLAAAEAAKTGNQPELYLFTDADIGHHRQNLSELVARLEEGGLDLASLMVELHCRSQAEKFMIPAFVWFFAMLRPFSWVNDPDRRTAAAAGGCVLVRRAAYERIGGYAAIHGELIDDCALAREVKRGGRIWLGLTRKTVSLRAYPRLRQVWDMVARTAYEYLDFSPWKLLGTVLGMGLAFLAPPVLALAGGASAWLALAAWAMMALAYAPMLSFYRVGLWRAPLLAGGGAAFPGRHARFRLAPHEGQRRVMEGTGVMAEPALRGAVETPSGKGRGDENFPVGSWLIRRDLRPHVHAFYRFAREADDIADNSALDAAEKLRRLDRMGAVLEGSPMSQDAATTRLRPRRCARASRRPARPRSIATTCCAPSSWTRPSCVTATGTT